MKALITLLLILVHFSNLFSQHTIRDNDILFQKKIIRSLPLKNDQNEKLFGKNNLIVKILLEAYQQGKLQGYADAGFSKVLCWDDYQKLVQYQQEGDSIFRYGYHDFNILELTEDLIVDKNRSEIIFNSTALTILISENRSVMGIIQPMVSFRYSDCVNVFKSDKRAFSHNPLLNGNDINFSEIFMLHMYASSIVKIGGIEDNYFDQMANSKVQAFLIGKEEEYELTNFLFKLFHPK